MKPKTVRIPADLHQELKEISLKTGLSVNSLILLASLNNVRKFFQQSKSRVN